MAASLRPPANSSAESELNYLPDPPGNNNSSSINDLKNSLISDPGEQIVIFNEDLDHGQCDQALNTKSVID